MNVIITGAAGFIGKALCRSLAEGGHRVFAVARMSSFHKISHIKGIDIIPLDISSPLPPDLSLPEADAVVHLAGIFREIKNLGKTFENGNFKTMKNALALAKKISAGRFIFLSAVGASPESKVKFLRSKFICEELIKNSDLDYLILRTPLVYGEGDNSTEHFLNLVKKTSLIPLIGNPEKKIKPLFVDDLTKGIKEILESKIPPARTLDLEGPELLTYRQMLETIAGLEGKKPRFFNLPQGALKFITKTLESFAFYPLSTDQLKMMDEEEIKSEDFCNYYPLPLHNYEDGIKETINKRNSN